MTDVKQRGQSSRQNASRQKPSQQKDPNMASSDPEIMEINLFCENNQQSANINVEGKQTEQKAEKEAPNTGRTNFTDSPDEPQEQEEKQVKAKQLWLNFKNKKWATIDGGIAPHQIMDLREDDRSHLRYQKNCVNHHLRIKPMAFGKQKILKYEDNWKDKMESQDPWLTKTTAKQRLEMFKKTCLPEEQISPYPITQFYTNQIDSGKSTSSPKNKKEISRHSILSKDECPFTPDRTQERRSQTIVSFKKQKVWANTTGRVLEMNQTKESMGRVSMPNFAKSQIMGSTTKSKKFTNTNKSKKLKQPKSKMPQNGLKTEYKWSFQHPQGRFNYTVGWYGNKNQYGENTTTCNNNYMFGSTVPRKVEPRDRQVKPGPAYYDAVKPDVLKTKMPSFTMGRKLPLNFDNFA